MARFCEAWSTFDTASDSAVREQLSIGIIQLFDHAGEVNPAPRRPALRASKAMRVLREAYESAPWQTVDIGAVAAELGLSYHWFVHDFSRVVGMPPYQYVQALRSAKLRRLLIEGPRPDLRTLTDLATLLGFSDKSHLHRSVVAEYGVSPWQLALQLNPAWSQGRRKSARRHA